MAASPEESQRLACGCEDGSIVLYDGKSLTEQDRLAGNGLRVVDLQFSPDGFYLFARHHGSNNQIEHFIWNLHRGGPPHRLDKAAPATSFWFSADRRRAAN